jgi:hypothetical protein
MIDKTSQVQDELAEEVLLNEHSRLKCVNKVKLPVRNVGNFHQVPTTFVSKADLILKVSCGHHGDNIFHKYHLLPSSLSVIPSSTF